MQEAGLDGSIFVEKCRIMSNYVDISRTKSLYFSKSCKYTLGVHKTRIRKIVEDGDLERRYFVGRAVCEEGIREFQVEYYVVERSDLFSIELIKEQGPGYGGDEMPESEQSFPISASRNCVEKLATTLLKNKVTPVEMYECLDDLYESWYE